VALVDDHTLFRDALGVVIDSFENCQVTILAEDGKELMRQLSTPLLPHLIVLDLNMPTMDGFETAAWLRLHHPDIKVLVLTMYGYEYAMIRLVKAGVRGFLKKDIHPDELERAIQSTIETGYYYSGRATLNLVKYITNEETNTSFWNTVTLTDKEITFLQLASTEKTYKEISAAMRISARTVENYRDSLFTKLQVKSRVGLVMYAIENGIVRIKH